MRELEIKQVIVRYIYHQLRSPLNAILLGLLHLATQLPKLDALAVSCEDVVKDLTTSCEYCKSVLEKLSV